VKGYGKELCTKTNSEGIHCYVVCKTREIVFVFVVESGYSVFLYRDNKIWNSKCQNTWPSKLCMTLQLTEMYV
jgi:hypothetical protein